LKYNAKNNDLKITVTEARCKSLEEELERLTKASKEANEKVDVQKNAAMKFLTELKIYENSYNQYKISYEKEIANNQLLKQECELLVLLNNKK